MTSTAQAERDSIRKYGTPVGLLQLVYVKLNVRLVICRGSLCRYVHTPLNWDRWPESRNNTVVLNIWGNCVFTYANNAVHGSYG